MKHLCVLLALAASPATAQGDVDEGLSLLDQGARLLFRGLLSEMEPALDEMRGLAEQMGPQMEAFARQMGPAMAELLRQIDDLTNYDAPVMLPNGDIIIRRKPGAPQFEPKGEVEL